MSHFLCRQGRFRPPFTNVPTVQLTDRFGTSSLPSTRRTSGATPPRRCAVRKVTQVVDARQHLKFFTFQTLLPGRVRPARRQPVRGRADGSGSAPAEGPAGADPVAPPSGPDRPRSLRRATRSRRRLHWTSASEAERTSSGRFRTTVGRPKASSVSPPRRSTGAITFDHQAPGCANLACYEHRGSTTSTQPRHAGPRTSSRPGSVKATVRTSSPTLCVPSRVQDAL